MAELFANGARGRLDADVTAGAVTLPLRTGEGARFPTFTAGDYAWVVVEEGTAGDPDKREVVRATGRSGDSLTVDRAQQGTSAVAFDRGARVELRLTAETFRSFQLARGFNRALPMGGVQPEGTGTFDAWGSLGGSASTVLVSRPVPALTNQGTSIPRILGTRFVANTGVPSLNLIGTAGLAPNLGGMEWLHRGPLEEDLSATRKILGVSDSNSTSLLAATEPSALTTVRMVAVGYDSTVAVGGDWQVFTNNASTVDVTPTSIAKVVGHVYQTRIWSPRGVAMWCVELTDLTGGSRYFGEFTSNVPVCGTNMYATLYTFRSSGTPSFSITGMSNFLW